MEALGGEKTRSYSFFTSALDGGATDCVCEILFMSMNYKMATVPKFEVKSMYEKFDGDNLCSIFSKSKIMLVLLLIIN
jgi:hypothetical protein